ncbi:hypothetical protein DFH08DRAFT_973124 [Mycena albidolilacea]|uniref:Ribonuclease H1 N-terminal domain-containing protein n=1 Tax=Mycena albidolilacea TaxID=1033008 RepID=A0AAD6ZA89_9AGAR|nr:hypothetical protein DFH08DRAFT_973124 [Mycena albidolilacea]
MSVDALVNATASLSLQYQCCDHCCKPTFFFLPDDPSEEVLSRHSKCKFYVVKRGSVGSEGIYTDWDVAKTKVNRISNAAHEASKTADGARAIWAQHCHRFHTHSPSLAAARPPPIAAKHTYVEIKTPPTINAHSAPITRSRKSLHANNAPKILPRVREPARDAEAELLSAAGSTLLVGNSLEDVEDDDEVTLVGGARFYRVFGSSRVHTSRDTVVPELGTSAGLLVGRSLAAVDVDGV